MSDRPVVLALQSGGMDSPALTYALARDNPQFDFQPLYLRSKLSPAYWYREEGCNEKIWELAKDRFPNVLYPTHHEHLEIRVSRARTQRRNQIYLKHLAEQVHLGTFGENIIGFSMGVVPAADMGIRWIHGWTTFGEDHRPDFLRQQLDQWGPELKLWTFADFGEHMEHRDERCKLYLELLGEESLFISNSCQLWYSGAKSGKTGGCGFCHSCQARAVAIVKVLGFDKTPYVNDPVKGKSFPQYVVAEQYMDGFIAALKHSTSKGYWNGVDIRKTIKDWLKLKLEQSSNGVASGSQPIR